MKLSRNGIVSVCGGDLVDEYSQCESYKVQTCVNCLMSDLIAKGLDYTEEKMSFHSSGRPEHMYDAQKIADGLDAYLLETWSHKKMTLRKAVALSVVSHLDMMGYKAQRLEPLSKEDKKLSKTEQLRVRIFGSKKAKEYRMR